MTIEEIKKSIVEAGKSLLQSGLISRTWGNISCRIDENTMAITPSGMDYNVITPEDIVEVRLSDCGYSGKRKPSVEKGIHASVYKLYPDVNFVIHTHQVNASVAGALGLKSVEVNGDYPLLGGEVLCAEYGIPGTKTLCRHVAESVKQAKGHAVIMVYHGAICFGKDRNEAFNAASQLENACEEFVRRQYMNISGEAGFDENKMRRFALTKAFGKYQELSCANELKYDSERTNTGFRLFNKSGDVINIASDKSFEGMPEEAKIYNEIFTSHKDISYIEFSDEPNTRVVSGLGIALRPLLDDFAQIIGTRMITADNEPSQIAAGLKKQSAVFIRNEGALCVGKTRDDAQATAAILEKTCKTLIGAALFNHVKPLNRLECCLMRLNYKINYSKAK